MVTTVQTKLNGVDVDSLVKTIEVIQGNPDLAKFVFRSQTQWIDGGQTRTEIKSFYGAGAEDTSREKPFIIEGDEPPVLLGRNHGPNAVESLLQALASCLTVGMVYNAAAQGIKIENLDLWLEGELDLHAFLGLSDTIRPGYKEITVNYRVKTSAPREKIVALCDYVQKSSPVMDMLRNPVPVKVNLVD